MRAVTLATMNISELRELIFNLRAGDTNHLKRVFEENASYCILGLVRKHKCFREDAEDIYVDAIINFREKLLDGKIEFLTDIRSYLFATCNNMFLARTKRVERVNKAVQEFYIEKQIFPKDDETGSRDELFALTEEGLSSLGEKCRNLLKSFYFDKLGLEEIALKFTMANGNVAKVSKSRCLQRLIDNIRNIREQKISTR
jgi:RNA polymerase sigma factor (sigma-70 family)